MKTCKICLNQFEPVRTLMVTCSYSCALAYSRGKIAKVVKAENKVKKERMKTKSQHLKELQTIFNKYIRLRDSQEPCISCRTISNVKYDAGHYIAVSESPALRFNEDNVHKQCSNYCNVNKSGNYHAYRFHLIDKIGVKRVEALESSRHIPIHLSIPEIDELKTVYKQKIKDLI
jgi:hypothetical protein